MEFILVQPGSMQVAVFEPACPPRPAAAASADVDDPRNVWTPTDFENCQRLVARDRSEGFAVEIAEPFYLGKFEVTQAQWAEIMGANPSTFAAGDGYSNRPVETITWDQAQAFVRALNQREGTEAYRLPTEFEWEFACRAGGPGQQSWEAIREVAVDGGESLGFGYGRTPRDPNLPPPTTFPVGQKEANAWGLHDMLGNVWEWTSDLYNERTFPDPQPPANGPTHVLKGSSFVGDVKNAICATHAGGPGNRWDVGLRIAKSAGIG
jgi:formylglycine-generating enzyme required for sulfatase activity